MKKLLFLFAALCCMMVANAQDAPSSDEIWYTATSEVTPTNILGTDDAALTVTSNNYDESTGIWKITFSGDVITIGENAFKGSKVLSSITIPASVTSIENSAFYQCYDSSKKTGLTTVTFAEDSELGTIGEQAFYGCKVLSSIAIPASVTSIGLQVFQNCSALESISVDAGNTVYSSPNDCNAIIETKTNTLIQGCKKTVIPESVKTIGASAFEGNGILESIAIPASVTQIENDAFEGCSQLATVAFAEGSKLETIGGDAFRLCSLLSSITIPASVTSIGDYAFDQCSKLATVTFAEDSELKTIGYRAFEQCYGLSSITIPASVTKIGYEAFSGCSNLTSVTVFWTETPPTPGTNAFNNISSSATLYVPFGTRAMYEAADVWKNFKIDSPESFKLKVSSTGWASMYLPCAVTIPSGAEVYYASAASGNTITLSKVEGTLPKETGVIVKAAAGTVNFAESAEAGSIDGTNLFEGTSVDKAFNAETDGGVYVLSGASAAGNPQFQEYSGSKLNAFKAYLPKSKVGSSAKEISVVFGETTSIQEASPISSPKGKDVMYDLNGMRVNPSTGSGQAYKGIVIKNGKKMFNK